MKLLAQLIPFKEICLNKILKFLSRRLPKSLDNNLEVLFMSKFIYGPGDMLTTSVFFPALWLK